MRNWLYILETGIIVEKPHYRNVEVNRRVSLSDHTEQMAVLRLTPLFCSITPLALQTLVRLSLTASISRSPFIQILL